MADIFISYSQQDRAWVERLVTALTAEGWEVWWDLNIRSGETFDRAIEQRLQGVHCVVAVWSAHAVDSNWVRAEAAWAMEQDKLVSIQIESEISLPIQFHLVHTLPMVGWEGSREALAFCKLVEDIRAVAGAPKTITDDTAGRASEIARGRQRNRFWLKSAGAAIVVLLGLAVTIEGLWWIIPGAVPDVDLDDNFAEDVKSLAVRVETEYNTEMRQGFGLIVGGSIPPKRCDDVSDLKRDRLFIVTALHLVMPPPAVIVKVTVASMD